MERSLDKISVKWRSLALLCLHISCPRTLMSLQNCLCSPKWELSAIMTKNDSNEVGQLRRLVSNCESFVKRRGYAVRPAETRSGRGESRGRGNHSHLTQKVTEMRGKLWRKGPLLLKEKRRLLRALKCSEIWVKEQRAGSTCFAITLNLNDLH